MKMKKVNKVLGLVLVTAALAFVVAGCQSDGEPLSGEHLSGADAKAEHPKSEHAKAEHPKAEHPK